MMQQACTFPLTRAGRPILSLDDFPRYGGRPRRHGRELRYRCFLHGGDHQYSLSLNEETGAYICHACGARGRVREYWEDRRGVDRPVSLRDHGRRALAAHAAAERSHAERLASPIPEAAATFLAQLDAMCAALAEPSCPGARYLRARGLDAALAAGYGAGYCAPNCWPGDSDRHVGRIVFPLADPSTGRIVSALGRLCIDADPRWSAERHAMFKAVKQRKLGGCPAGVWPLERLQAAQQTGWPLVLVEGPADVLGLAALDPALPALALCGTGNVLPMQPVRGVTGVIIALDADQAGARGSRELRTALELAGIPRRVLAPGWMGAQAAKDAGDLARAGTALEPARRTLYLAAQALVEPWYERLYQTTCALQDRAKERQARGDVAGAAQLRGQAEALQDGGYARAQARMYALVTALDEAAAAAVTG
jgi:hypothetical protein